jgi:hypothetical protein
MTRAISQAASVARREGRLKLNARLDEWAKDETADEAERLFTSSST